jgi:hypothetical protein
VTSSICCILLSCGILAEDSPGQAVISGRVFRPTVPPGVSSLPVGGVFVFGMQQGQGKLSLVHRSWDSEPVGWYRLAGAPGNYTLLLSNPAGFMRPIVQCDVRAELGSNRCNIQSRADYAVFSESDWDRQPAAAYYQPFVAEGRSVTEVGFKLANDGVDGSGPGSQDLELSIRRMNAGPPESWQQVGPAIPILGVDCGGAKNRTWSAGWDSGEAPVQRGKTYAVCLKARKQPGTFQAFWQPCSDGAACCYRQGRKGAAERTGFRVWMSVATDDDALVIPYNKRVHREYGEFAGFQRKWSQTFVAQGGSLAGVVLYAAVGGTQPPLDRQHVAIRIRRGGPAGDAVGAEKVAIGNGIYTGDASWGVFGAAFARDEVPLVAGTTYAVEFETLETPETLRGFVNIKGQVSDARPGFNPYRKVPPDNYAKGTAYRDGREPADFDLDMQIVEFAATDGQARPERR